MVDGLFIGIVLSEYLSVQHVVSTLLLRAIDAIDIKMSNLNVEKKNIYGKAMESFLSHQPKAWKQQHGGKLNG